MRSSLLLRVCVGSGAAPAGGASLFTGARISDGGLERTAFTVTLAEERAACIQGMSVSLGFDAGFGRVMQIDLESLDGTPLSNGTYRWPSADAGALLSVSRFTTPRGVIIPADTAQLEVSSEGAALEVLHHEVEPTLRYPRAESSLAAHGACV